jgi:hypothetical protein
MSAPKEASKKKTRAEAEERIRLEEEEALKLLHEPRPDPTAKDPAVRYAAECVTPCTFRGRYWRRGDEYRGFARPPEHFVIVEEENREAGAVPSAEEENRGERAGAVPSFD